jgi:hypothetical protein
MFGTGRTSRAHAAQRVAEDAWEHLVAAVDSAGDTARSAGRRTQSVADDAGSSVVAVADEARRRAGAALDALAGRSPRTRWEWVAGAVVAGLVVGWFAAAGARKAAALAAEEERTTDLGTSVPLDASAKPEA